MNVTRSAVYFFVIKSLEDIQAGLRSDEAILENGTVVNVLGKKGAHKAMLINTIKYNDEALIKHQQNNMEAIYTPNHIVFDFVEDM